MSDFVEGAKYGKEIYEDNDDDIPRKKQRLGRWEKREEERKTFHGAFKGGFSAGHFGTVGSKEGWEPKNFKSSRTDARSRFSKPLQGLDAFMDSEDEESFGSRSTTIRPNPSFATGERGVKRVPHTDRQLLDFSLEGMLKPTTENVGKKLLCAMGWKPGQGIGKKISLKKKNPELNSAAPSAATVSPDDVQALITKFKEDTFGLGYKGIERPTFKSVETRDHVFGVIGKEKTKIRISGQAFGVGLDDDEEDIDVYSRQDMSQYDFDLGPKERKPQKQIMSGSRLDDRFHKSSQPSFVMKYYKPPELPKGFKIESLKTVTQAEQSTTEEGDRLMGRKERFDLLGQASKTEWEAQEQAQTSATESKDDVVDLDLMRRILSNRFVSRGTDQEPSKIIEDSAKETPLIKPRRGGRTTVEWFPDKLLCMRFNVPCPYLSAPERKRESKSKVPLFTALALAKQQREQPQDGDSEHPAVLPMLALLPPTPQIAPAPTPSEITVSKNKVLDVDGESKRPPMDLFKAIFADSDSESEEESSEVKEEVAQPVPSSLSEPAEEPEMLSFTFKTPGVESKVAVYSGSSHASESRADLILSTKPVFMKASERVKSKTEADNAPQEFTTQSKGPRASTAEEIKRSLILERLREFDDEPDSDESGGKGTSGGSVAKGNVSGSVSKDENILLAKSVGVSDDRLAFRYSDKEIILSSESEDEWIEAPSEKKTDKKKKKKHQKRQKDKKKKKKSS